MKTKKPPTALNETEVIQYLKNLENSFDSTAEHPVIPTSKNNGALTKSIVIDGHGFSLDAVKRATTSPSMLPVLSITAQPDGKFAMELTVSDHVWDVTHSERYYEARVLETLDKLVALDKKLAAISKAADSDVRMNIKKDPATGRHYWRINSKNRDAIEKYKELGGEWGSLKCKADGTYSIESASSTIFYRSQHAELSFNAHVIQQGLRLLVDSVKNVTKGDAWVEQENTTRVVFNSDKESVPNYNQALEEFQTSQCLQIIVPYHLQKAHLHSCNAKTAAKSLRGQGLSKARYIWHELTAGLDIQIPVPTFDEFKAPVNKRQAWFGDSNDDETREALGIVITIPDGKHLLQQIAISNGKIESYELLPERVHPIALPPKTYQQRTKQNTALPSTATGRAK